MTDQKHKVMEKRRQGYERMGYRFVGPRKHSAIKICQWCKQSLRGKGYCYKQRFYGIDSSRCIQMTPNFFTCSANCLFCWRPMRFALPRDQEWDSPKDIMDGCIEAQREIIQGFRGNPQTSEAKFKKAEEPNQVAISLAGEPMLYPFIGDLIQEIKSRGMSSFLVTNGTLPEKLEELLEKGQEPTQTYVTLAAPDKAILAKTTQPILKDSWERLQETLSLMSRFSRSVIRLTLVKNLNFTKPEKYGELIESSGVDWVEVKSFMSVGGARDRLPYEDMPLFPEIQEFAEKVEKVSGYKIVDEKKESRVVLLSRDGKKKLIKE